MATPNTSKKWQHTQLVLTNLAGVLLIIPLAPLICRFIPPIMLGEYNVDMVLAVLISLVVVRLLIWLVRPLIIPALVVMLAFIGYNHLTGKYGFDNIFYDYKALAYSNWQVREKKQTDLLSINPGFFENRNSKGARAILAKVQITDSVVRNFAVKHSLTHFKEYQQKYGMTTRFLSLFKYINQEFNYVPDSKRDEYFASARETIENGMGGDCDDHSILMASALMSIGAKCRLVIIEGHMYPELYAGNKGEFEELQQAIVQLFNDQRVRNIFYHEHDGHYWINLDYSARHPGGPYLNDKLKLVIDL